MNPQLTIVATALLAALVPAQDGSALTRAQVLERNEGDLRAAEQAYRALLADPQQASQHAEAALRLGTLLWRLDRKDEARPLLERAAQAGGPLGAQANAVLQGQGDEAKQAAERLVRAQALVEQLELDRRQGPRAEQPLRHCPLDLLALGSEGATALIARLRTWREGLRETIPQQPNPYLDTPGELAGALWEIGTELGRKFFAEAAVDPSVEWRRTMVERCENATPEMFDSAMVFLHDNDPVRIVPNHVVTNLGRRLPLAALRTLATRGAMERSASIRSLTWQWPTIPAAERGDLAIEFRNAMAQTLSEHGSAAVAGIDLFETILRDGPDAARTVAMTTFPLYVQALELAGRDANIQADRAVLDDAAVKYLLATVQPLGKRGDAPISRGEKPIAMLLMYGRQRWTASSIGLVLDIVDALPARAMAGQSGVQWLEHLVELADEQALARLVAGLDRLGTQTGYVLLAHPLPAAVFPKLRQQVERLLPADPVDSDGNTRLRQAIALAAHADPTAAPPFLAAVAERDPGSLPFVVTTLCEMTASPATEQAIADAWTKLFATQPEATYRAIPNIVGGASARVSLPIAAVPSLLTVIQSDFVPYGPLATQQRRIPEQRLRNVAETFGHIALTAVSKAPLADDLRHFLTTANSYAAVVVFSSLPRDVANLFATEGRALLHRESSVTFVAVLQKRGIEPTTEDWLLLLKNADRQYVLPALPTPLPPALQPTVAALVADDPSPDVRVAACWALARTCGADAVGPLLAVLQDANETVRNAATQALEQLRREREQRAFWAKAGSEVDTSPASATTRLVTEAMPDQPKDQRLLAIRSLAALHATTALPYLITWAREGDAEIAAAARAAIDSLLAEPATK